MSSSSKSLYTLSVPDIGKGNKIELVDWYISLNDEVVEGQELCELVTDKAAFPLEAPCDGIVHDVCKDKGSMVEVGEALVVLQANVLSAEH